MIVEILSIYQAIGGGYIISVLVTKDGTVRARRVVCCIQRIVYARGALGLRGNEGTISLYRIVVIDPFPRYSVVLRVALGKKIRGPHADVFVFVFVVRAIE